MPDKNWQTNNNSYGFGGYEINLQINNFNKN